MLFSTMQFKNGSGVVLFPSRNERFAWAARKSCIQLKFIFSTAERVGEEEKKLHEVLNTCSDRGVDSRTWEQWQCAHVNVRGYNKLGRSPSGQLLQWGHSGSILSMFPEYAVHFGKLKNNRKGGGGGVPSSI